jgi:hypothetical protein
MNKLTQLLIDTVAVIAGMLLAALIFGAVGREIEE